MFGGMFLSLSVACRVKDRVIVEGSLRIYETFSPSASVFPREVVRTEGFHSGRRCGGSGGDRRSVALMDKHKVKRQRLDRICEGQYRSRRLLWSVGSWRHRSAHVVVEDVLDGGIYGICT